MVFWRFGMLAVCIVTCLADLSLSVMLPGTARIFMPFAAVSAVGIVLNLVLIRRDRM